MRGDLEQMAIARLREAARTSERHYDAPLIITFSGGKDSSVLLELARRSGIAFEVAHNLTTVDAPDTVYFVRETFKRLEADGTRCTVNYPYYKGERATMWSLIPAKGMPPTRIMRYCCDVLKERNNAKRYIATGVRWAESRARKTRGVYESVNANPEKRVVLFHDNDERRRLMEVCMAKRRVVCNPIIDWTDADVWDYIRAEKIPVNPLYECGFSRVGCIGCPMARLRMREFEFARYPKYRAAYIRAFGKMLERRRERGKLDDKWRIGDTAEAIFHWWMGDGVLDGQTDLWGGV